MDEPSVCGVGVSAAQFGMVRVRLIFHGYGAFGFRVSEI